MDQGGQERDPVDTPIVPQVRPQCRSPPASRARLQPRQLHAHPRAARCHGTVVTDQPCERSSSRSERRSCATGATSRSRWPRLSFLVTCSPTSCAVSTGSDRRQPRHERRHPVPSRRRRQDRCARIAGKNAIPRHQRRQSVHNHPDARRWPSFEGELHVERFRITLNGLGGFHMGNPGQYDVTVGGAGSSRRGRS